MGHSQPLLSSNLFTDSLYLIIKLGKWTKFGWIRFGKILKKLQRRFVLFTQNFAEQRIQNYEEFLNGSFVYCVLTIVSTKSLNKYLTQVWNENKKYDWQVSKRPSCVLKELQNCAIPRKEESQVEIVG